MSDRLERFVERLPIPPIVRHHWLSFSFFFGFLLDNITLNRVDQLLDILVLTFYILLSMISLWAVYASSAERLPERINRLARTYAPMLVQFAFGGVLSGMLIFYGRSGDWLVSWPYLLIILSVIYFNETLHDRTTRLIFNLIILFIGLFSYVVLFVPVITGKMGAWVFVLSGLFALILMCAFLRALYFAVPRFMDIHMRSIIFSIGVIYASLNFLYFANVIPPIPLSLKEAGIYHSVIRFENGDYELKYEEGRWWQPFKNSDSVFHPSQGGAIFCFARVYTPTTLNTEIYHRWEYKNENGDWVEHFRTSYPIYGGNNNGYRGYTLVRNFTDGRWRCSVETARGQVLGREYFTVDSSGQPATLVTKTE